MRIWDKAGAKTGLLRRLPLGDYPLTPAARAKIRQVFGQDLSPEQVVAQIVDQVRREGDAALRRLTLAIDGVAIDEIEVTAAQRQAAQAQVPAELISALTLAAQRIEAFHRRLTLPKALPQSQGSGRLLRPLHRVGLYVPGGGANYPSTLLMAAIPARVAGVEEVYVVTPPDKRGGLSPLVLLAAHLGGVSRMFRVGGAQAIAALAWGTLTVPQVDKICGPGNIFVQIAKKQVYGMVDIDGIYGPTELVVVADEGASPRLCAAELLGQAEHDPLATAVLITPSAALAHGVQRELGEQMDKLPRKEAVAQALEGRGGIVLVADMEEAIELANEYAPEHLCLIFPEADAWVVKVRHAGCISINSPVAWADYMAGPSHILPTGGSARFSSPLGVEAFLKATNIVSWDKKTLAHEGQAALEIAQAEGLTAHALSLEKWLEETR